MLCFDEAGGTSDRVLLNRPVATLRCLSAETLEYLRTPPTRGMLCRIVDAMGAGVRALVRQKGTPYDALGLDDPNRIDDELLDFIVEHPILMNRPVVVPPLGTALCRPSERVLELLPVGRVAPFTKEDGEVVHDPGFRRG